MAKIICHHKGRFNLYCTISDNFKWSRSISERKLRGYYNEKWEQGTAEDFKYAVDKAIENGMSSFEHFKFGDHIVLNKDGEDEARDLHKDILKRFINA